MGANLRNRSFLKELDFTPDELRFLLKLAADLKSAKNGGYERPTLVGKNIALIFEKTSTRTRTAFEVAAHDQGAHVTYLEPSGSQIGHKESMRDTARVLGRIYDGIEYRGFAQETVEILAGPPACRSGTGSPTSSTRHRPSATSSRWPSTAPNRSPTSASATSAMPSSTWATP